MLRWTLFAALVAASMLATPGSLDPQIGPDGMLDLVEVVAQVPDHLRGAMPEVVVEAEVPEHARGITPEVMVVADGPVVMLEEVVVVARAPAAVQAQTMHVAAHNVGAGPEEVKWR